MSAILETLRIFAYAAVFFFPLTGCLLAGCIYGIGLKLGIFEE